MRKCPCKGCNKRYKACHDTCKEYKDWKKELDTTKTWLRNVNTSITSQAAERSFKEKLRRR